jgi:hypothetical protein
MPRLAVATDGFDGIGRGTFPVTMVLRVVIYRD